MSKKIKMVITAILLGTCLHTSSVFAEPDSYRIEDFPLIMQMPELPTGCEITALTMALNYYGFQIDKVTMATEYLPTLPSADVYITEDGILYGNDMNQFFIGDPASENGVICGTGAIVTAADLFLENAGSDMRAVDRSGSNVQELYQLVSEDIPVVVWCTIGMDDRNIQQGWYTEQGEYVDWAKNDHGAVLIGYNSDYVTIADPLEGIVEYNRTQFERVFESRNQQCVTIE